MNFTECRHSAKASARQWIGGTSRNFSLSPSLFLCPPAHFSPRRQNSPLCLPRSEIFHRRRPRRSLLTLTPSPQPASTPSPPPLSTSPPPPCPRPSLRPPPIPPPSETLARSPPPSTVAADAEGSARPPPSAVRAAPPSELLCRRSSSPVQARPLLPCSSRVPSSPAEIGRAHV